jgi:lambda repressor-like predicted transcriptional regulator
MIIDGTVPMPEGCHIVDGRIERIITSEMKAEQLRNQRNSLLAACDWTQVADSPVDKTVWAAYRQSLRDITDQLGWPEQIIWPQRPQEEL